MVGIREVTALWVRKANKRGCDGSDRAFKNSGWQEDGEERVILFFFP